MFFFLSYCVRTRKTRAIEIRDSESNFRHTNVFSEIFSVVLFHYCQSLIKNRFHYCAQKEHRPTINDFKRSKYPRRDGFDSWQTRHAATHRFLSSSSVRIPSLGYYLPNHPVRSCFIIVSYGWFILFNTFGHFKLKREVIIFELFSKFNHDSSNLQVKLPVVLNVQKFNIFFFFQNYIITSVRFSCYSRTALSCTIWCRLL